MKSKNNPGLPGENIKFQPNLTAGVLAGLFTGGFIGLVMGLKIARINPSLTDFKEIWLLAAHFIVIYGIIGLVIGGLFAIVSFPILKRRGLKKAGSLMGFYLPALLFLGLFYYIRSYIVTHFVVNPLMPLKGADWLNLLATVIVAAIAYSCIITAVKISGGWKWGRIAAIFAGLFVVVWVGAYFLVPGEKRNAGTAFEEFSITPSGKKVALIGIDGAWWEIMTPLMEAGELPNFQKLAESGSTGELKTLYPTYSPMIWSSIATGKLPQKHGINSFLVWIFPVTGAQFAFFRLPKFAPELLWMQENLAIVAPVPSNYRTTSALWNIASDNGSTAGMMGWLASWPAETLNGYVYTDHALYNKMDILTNYKLKSDSLGGEVYPPELLSEIQQFTYTPKDITREDLSRFVNVESDGFWEEFRMLDTYEYIDVAYEASMFKFSFPGDKTIIETGNYLLKTYPQPDFWTIYLQGMDSMSHQYLKYYFLENQDKLIPLNVERYRNLMVNYYKYMDETVGRIMAELDSNTVVMIVSDHGFDKQMLPTGHYNHILPSESGETQDFHICAVHPGIFIAAGPGIKSGYKAADIDVLDIAPTVLAVMGLPYASDFDGQIDADIFADTVTVDTIPTYDREARGSRAVSSTSVDKGVRDKLKALGYVK